MNTVHGKNRALRNKVLVRNIDQGMRKSKGGIILAQSDSVSDGASGIRPRWAEVYSVGSNIDWIKEGQWVLMEHGRWTMPVKINDGESEFDLRQADPEGILGYSESKPDDIQSSSKTTF